MDGVPVSPNGWLKRDAVNRSWRTVLQGVVALLVVPALDAALQIVQRDMLGMFAGQPFDWKRTAVAAGVSASSAAVMALTAYVHRLKVDPSPVPSAEPPRPPGVSVTEAPATEPVTVIGTVRDREPGGAVRTVVYAEVDRRNWWRTAFLGLTGLLAVLVVGMEISGAVDRKGSTETWTELIVQYVHPEVFFSAVGGLLFFVLAHFGVRYWRKRHS